MARLLLISALVLCFSFSAMAQSSRPQSPDDVIKRARESFKTAKNNEEIESVKMWCKAALVSLTFKESERLLLQSIKLMEANKADEANALTARVAAIDELNNNLAKLVCRPD